MTASLVLLRHGASEWSELGRFTGWADVPLAARGAEQAAAAGRMLASAGLAPDVVHTSVLQRAIRTADIVLAELGAGGAERHATALLNERNYGELQGRSKQSIAEEYGQEQFALWRRSFDIAPPGGESLALVLERVLSYWTSAILPELEAGRSVLVVSHSNALRALVKHLDGLDDREIVAVNIPTGIPLLYEVEPGVRMARRGYLDAEAASAAALAVANEGVSGTAEAQIVH